MDVFDGIEDITVTSTEEIDEKRFLLRYYFDLRILIWTVEMDASVASANAARLDDHFINRELTDGLATMEIVQCRYFRGSTVFNRDTCAFTDATITLSALKPTRRPRKAT